MTMSTEKGRQALLALVNQFHRGMPRDRGEVRKMCVNSLTHIIKSTDSTVADRLKSVDLLSSIFELKKSLDDSVAKQNAEREAVAAAFDKMSCMDIQELVEFADRIRHEEFPVDGMLSLCQPVATKRKSARKRKLDE